MGFSFLVLCSVLKLGLVLFPFVDVANNQLVLMVEFIETCTNEDATPEPLFVTEKFCKCPIAENVSELMFSCYRSFLPPFGNIFECLYILLIYMRRCIYYRTISVNLLFRVITNFLTIMMRCSFDFDKIPTAIRRNDTN